MNKIDIETQNKLLLRCIDQNSSLADELAKIGSTYDELRYRTNSIEPVLNGGFRGIDDWDVPSHGVPVVSFFSGAGGLDLGFEAAGFKHLAAFEIDPIFCATMRLNRPSWRIVGPPSDSGDLRDREKTESILSNEIGINRPFEGVFYGGPPCQPFSVASSQRFPKNTERFKRLGFAEENFGGLLFDFIFYIERFRPKVFMLENVPGLLTMDDGVQLTQASERLTEIGYKVSEPAIIPAMKHGVPQNRKRLFLIGHRTQREFHPPTEEPDLVSTCTALSGVPNDALNHSTRNHAAGSILRYMELDYGQREPLGRVDRLHPNLPAKTVIAGGSQGGGRSHLHPNTPRTLSPRECARLQTIPDSWEFTGTIGRQMTQIGNAVPPLLAAKLAKAIFDSLY